MRRKDVPEPAEYFPLTDYSVWSAPGSLTVHLSADVVERLGKQLAGVPQGLLIGRVAGAITEIVDFKIAAATELLAAQARAALADVRKGLRLMGYFRVQRHGDLRLTNEDVEFMTAVFPSPNDVVLVIQAEDPGTSRASFFCWDEGRISTDSSVLEFPFDCSRLVIHRAAPHLPIEGTGDTPAGQPWLAKVGSAIGRKWRAALAIPKLGIQVPQKRHALLAILLLGTIALTLIAGGFVSRRVAPFVSTGLEIERRPQGDLKLTWNHHAPVIAEATSATLLIEDGDVKRTLVLDQSLVRTGSLFYTPASEEILMTFSVQGPEKTASETVLMVIPNEARRK